MVSRETKSVDCSNIQHKLNLAMKGVQKLFAKAKTGFIFSKRQGKN